MFEVRKYGFFNLWLLLFFVVAIIGSAVLNIYLVLSSLFLIYHLLKKNFVLEIKSNKWIAIYLIFFVFIVVNSFYAVDFYSSIKSSTSQIRFFLFSLLIIFFFKIENISKLIISLSILNIFVCFDTLIQYFYGRDFFGISASPITNPGRYSGPFGDELIVGAYLYLSSSLIFSFFILDKTKNITEISYRLFYIVIVITTIILSGERMNTLLAISTLFILIFYKFKNKQKILLTILLMLFLVFFYNFNKVVQSRFDTFAKDVLMLQNSNHGKLFSSAYDIWKNNFFTGVGLKNFRFICDENKLNTVTNTKNICSTHPHNFYFEIISEIGGIGLFFILCFFIFSFFSFLKVFSISRDKFLLFNLFIILIYFGPFIPRGSFFNNWNAIIFWVIFSILYSSYNKLKKIND